MSYLTESVARFNKINHIIKSKKSVDSKKPSTLDYKVNTSKTITIDDITNTLHASIFQALSESSLNLSPEQREEFIFNETSAFFVGLKAENPDQYEKLLNSYLNRFVPQEVTDEQFKIGQDDLIVLGYDPIPDTAENRSELLRKAQESQLNKLNTWLDYLQNESGLSLKQQYIIFNSIAGLEEKSFPANVSEKELKKALNKLATDSKYKHKFDEQVLSLMGPLVNTYSSSNKTRDDKSSFITNMIKSRNLLSPRVLTRSNGIKMKDFFDDSGEIKLSKVYSFILNSPINKKIKLVSRAEHSLKPIIELNKDVLKKAAQEMNSKLSGSNFTSLYTRYINDSLNLQAANFKTTEGQWMKFEKDSNAQDLVDSLEGYNTGWCTCEYATAQAQL